jgi:hypothetical protein
MGISMSGYAKKAYITHSKEAQLAANLEASQQNIRNLEWLNEQEIKAHQKTALEFAHHKRDGHKLVMAAVIFGFVLGYLSKGLA